MPEAEMNTTQITFITQKRMHNMESLISFQTVMGEALCSS
jgi:hypothetical protein